MMSEFLEQPIQSDNSKESENDIFGKIENLVAMADEDFEKQVKQLIAERLAILESSSKIRELSLPSKVFYQGFLHPESGIKRVAYLDPVRIDDPEIYEILLHGIKRFKQSEGWQDKSVKEISAYAVQDTISRYFGNAFGTEGTNSRNMKFYMDWSTADSPPISISEFKEKAMGVCAEKAPVAQNLATFLGIESYLVMSDQCKLTEEPMEDAHVYNIIHNEKGYFIYDPTNPRQVVDESGRLIAISPASYAITTEQFESIKKGEKVQIDHQDWITKTNGEKEAKISQRVYGGPTR